MKEPEAVVSKPPHMRWDRKNALVGGTVLIVLIIVGITWAVIKNDAAEPASKVPQYSGQELVNEVNKRYGNNDYIGAIRLIQGQKTINETETQLLLAGAYTNAGSNDKALVIYEKLDQQNKLNETYYATAADVAERAKSYDKAVMFYKKAKQLADPKATDQIAVYDYKIAELEKKQ